LLALTQQALTNLGGGAFWLTREASEAGDPSLRPKNGYAQDDTAV